MFHVTKWKMSVKDIGGEVLCVSQFTLYASTKKGNKPDFHGAMGGEQAKQLYHHFVQKVGQEYNDVKVKDGVFQAMMEVALVNDGPVTLEIQVGDKKPVGNSIQAGSKKADAPTEGGKNKGNETS